MPRASSTATTVMATTSNSSGDSVFLDFAGSSALLQVTQNYDPGGGRGIYNNDNVGV